MSVTAKIEFVITAEVDLDREDFKDSDGNQMSLLEIKESFESEIGGEGSDDISEFCSNYDYRVSKLKVEVVDSR